jgi:hypothetical protein
MILRRKVGMKHFLNYCALAGIIAVGIAANAFAGSVTVGSENGGNCYPFMCNDSGTSSGPSIQYQQVYTASAFGSSPISINSETFNLWSQDSSGTMIGGTYVGYLSTTSAAVNGLNAGCLSCNVGADAMQVFDFTIPSGGIPSGASYTINNMMPFLFNPTQGNLLLDIFVTNQDNVPNTGFNSYNSADYSGQFMSRAWAYNGSNSGSADSGALVTTFGTGTATPEPATLMLLGGGLAGLALLKRRGSRS